jgi:hypothetical protein
VNWSDSHLHRKGVYLKISTTQTLVFLLFKDSQVSICPQNDENLLVTGPDFPIGVAFWKNKSLPCADARTYIHSSSKQFPGNPTTLC